MKEAERHEPERCLSECGRRHEGLGFYVGHAETLAKIRPSKLRHKHGENVNGLRVLPEPLHGCGIPHLDQPRIKQPVNKAPLVLLAPLIHLLSGQQVRLLNGMAHA